MIHIIAAAIWTGGHLVLAIGFLPKALKDQDPGVNDFFNPATNGLEFQRFYSR
ncbi:MAG: hypothetical protein VX497_02305 [Candidatus Neomarinimicrobiota bacterium]|nr:hypothetical protein [Candidatus Neomarinimicrobiota bacterium]